MQSEKSKSRIKNLSTRYLGYYKAFGYILIASFALFVLSICFQEFSEKRRDLFGSLYSIGLMAYGIYVWWNVNKRVYQVEFDDDFLYVLQSKQDLLIPLENIKDVNLVSVGGVYRVDLYAKEQFGDRLYFKPSLLYPFNHKKKEALVNILWANIEKAKRKKQDFQRNALHS